MFKAAILTTMVSDMKRAIAFYTETLGFEKKEVYGDEWAEVTMPGVRIGLHPGGKKPLVAHDRHYAIGFRVEDLDQAVTALEAKGVAFTEHADRGSRLAYFTDPDGNPMYLIEIKWG